jgi:hypothetical protein
VQPHCQYRATRRAPQVASIDETAAAPAEFDAGGRVTVCGAAGHP